MRKLMKTKVLSDIEPLVARLDHLMAPSDALRVLHGLERPSAAAQRLATVGATIDHAVLPE